MLATSPGKGIITPSAMTLDESRRASALATYSAPTELSSPAVATIRRLTAELPFVGVRFVDRDFPTAGIEQLLRDIRLHRPALASKLRRPAAGVYRRLRRLAASSNATNHQFEELTRP